MPWPPPSPPPVAQIVLNVEAAWVKALAARDAAAVATILAPEFVHIDYRGEVQNRDQALRTAAKPKPFQQKIGDETVTVEGTVAIVRGINTISSHGRTVVRLRFTDVFALQAGQWRAVSAQETAIR